MKGFETVPRIVPASRIFRVRRFGGRVHYDVEMLCEVIRYVKLGCKLSMFRAFDFT